MRSTIWNRRGSCSLLAIGFVFFMMASAVQAQLVISQIFGAAGQNAGAANGDFVEIFNRSCVTINLNGYSLQVAGSASSTTWAVVALPNYGLDPGRYYCVRLVTTSIGTAYTADLNSSVGDILLSSSGKAAIVAGVTPLSGSCPALSSVVDFVAYNATSGVVCTEGTEFSPTSGIAAGRGYQRKLGGCQDTNVNLTDFQSDTNPATPRTSATAANTCASPATYGGCDLTDGSCRAVAGAAACTALNGFYHGDCMGCDIPGACCLPTPPNGSCIVELQADCQLDGGFFNVGQFACPPTPACPGLGRCCALDGTCTSTFGFQCASPNIFGGTGTTCTGTPCQGACCEPVSGSCTLTGSSNCTAPSSFAGVGTTCTATICQGRCCAPNGDCALTGPDGCSAPNLFGGLGSSCTGSPCQGACCVAEDGTCVLSGPGTCMAPNAFGGLGSTCASVQCSGRCCQANGSCTVTAVGQCSGVFSVGQTCDPVDVFTFDGVGLAVTGPAVSDVRTVPTAMLITDLDVDLQINHTWVGDLTVSLTHLGQTVVLADQVGIPPDPPGGGCASDNWDVILDDEAAASLDSQCGWTTPALMGTFSPDNPLSAFDGLDAQGDWTITLLDNFPAADNGTLLRWSLHVSHPGQACPSTGCTCFGDLNADSTVNGKDIKAFANCLAGGGAGCPCGDINHSGTVTAADIGPFIAAVLAGACAP